MRSSLSAPTAVADVADDRAGAVRHGGDERRPHAVTLRMLLRVAVDGSVCFGNAERHRFAQLLRRHIRAQDCVQLVEKGADRKAAGDLPAVLAAHAVAHDRNELTVRRAALHGKGILIFVTLQSNVRDAAGFHCPLSFASISLRRSWPQEASISPPRLRRTVAVRPWDSNRF